MGRLDFGRSLLVGRDYCRLFNRFGALKMGMDSYRFDRACQLERKLHLMLGSRRDVLMDYSKWLAENGIPQEDDGYPSSQAYDDHNINLFVKQQREAANV